MGESKEGYPLPGRGRPSPRPLPPSKSETNQEPKGKKWGPTHPVRTPERGWWSYRPPKKSEK